MLSTPKINGLVAIIANNHKGSVINDNLEMQMRTLYDYWFNQFEFPNKDGKPYKTSGGKLVWNQCLQREIPENWSSLTLGEIVKCHDSKRIPLSGEERSKMHGNYPYYGATGIMDKISNYIFDGDYILMAEDGSVMDSKGNPILQRISGKTWVNNHAHVLEPISNICPRMLMLMLKDVQVSKIKTGSIQMKINQEKMNGIPLLKIPQYLIDIFNPIINLMDLRILQLIHENEELINLRDYLLPLLMNGQITIE